MVFDSETYCPGHDNDYRVNRVNSRGGVMDYETDTDCNPCMPGIDRLLF